MKTSNSSVHARRGVEKSEGCAGCGESAGELRRVICSGDGTKFRITVRAGADGAMTHENMTHENQDIRRLAATLRENVAKCAQDPDVDPVHDTRTGTRRLQATLESLVRELPEGDAGQAVRDAATAAMQALKKIRRAAAPVRDLDVHRKLVSKLAKRAIDPARAKRARQNRQR